uniref:RING-type E3 ubiquitin transferase n=1 Tax=Leersia perrieri TaxID=77586 RepID=A0A0D9UZM2_9ORYZ
MAEETATTGGLYYCHMCSSPVSAVAASSTEEEIKCPYCHSGFVEEIESATAAEDPAGGEDGPGSVAGSGSGVWAPIIDGVFAGGRHHRSRRVRAAAASTAGGELDLLDFSERRRRTAGLLLLLQEMREHRLESYSSAGGGGSGSGSSDVEADNFRRRSGLDALVERLGAGRQATRPAKKEAVEAMPTVDGDSAAAGGACAVCLEDYGGGGGEVAREMPCRHKFHGSCIVRWLESNSSCPICRFQLPTDDDAGGGDGAAVSIADLYARRMPLSAELREIRSLLAPWSSSSSTSGSSSQRRGGD